MLASALVLGLASSARAANLAPNPGFETAVPLQWGPFNSTLLHYPVSPHSGAASLRVIATGSSTIASALSDCFPVSASTTYNLAAWYLVASPVTISFVGYGASFFSDAGCSSFVSAPAGASTGSPIIDGGWHSISAQQTAPGNAQSARLQLNFSCVQATCLTSPGSQLFDAVQYDDLEFDDDSGPTAVNVRSLTARRSLQGVLVHWRTGTEADVLGFNVYRQVQGMRVRVNSQLVPAQGGAAGSSYSYRDRRAPRHSALRYWLQHVNVDGTRTWHGPVRVSGT